MVTKENFALEGIKTLILLGVKVVNGPHIERNPILLCPAILNKNGLQRRAYRWS